MVFIAALAIPVVAIGAGPVPSSHAELPGLPPPCPGNPG